jgi:hypothetical protein
MSFTQIPDLLIDAKNLDCFELTAAVVIARKTIGWGKTSDGISLTQFMDHMKVSKPTAIKAIAGLINKRVVEKTYSFKDNGGQSFNKYSFTKSFVDAANEGRFEGDTPVKEVYSPSKGGLLPLSTSFTPPVKEVYTQDKASTKETRQDKSILENTGQTEQQASQLEAPAIADGESKKTKPRTDKAFLAECKQSQSFDLKGVPEPMILEFIKYRRELKKPLQTSKGVQGIINALAELKSETSMQVAVNYTMENEWMKIVIPAAPAPTEPTSAMMQAASAKGIVNGAVKVQVAAMVEYHTRKQNKVLDWDRAFSIWIERGAQFVAARNPATSRAEVAANSAAKAYERLFGEKLPSANCIEGELA